MILLYCINLAGKLMNRIFSDENASLKSFIVKFPRHGQTSLLPPQLTCTGSPISFPSSDETLVCTLCSKFDGPEIAGLFFLDMPNMFFFGEIALKSVLQNEEVHPATFSLLHI